MSVFDDPKAEWMKPDNMSVKEYKSRIDKPVVYTTSKGSTYVTAFDVVRSTAGRELIRKHAAMAISMGLGNGMTCAECGGECPDRSTICNECVAKLLDGEVME